MPNYEALSSDRSEFQGEAGPQYLTPSGRPRRLSVGERAALLRREGMRPGSPFGPSQRTIHDYATNPDPGSIQLTRGFRQN
ncbi:hypothetical protein SAMN05216282_11142 [Cryobacterium psychrotolerans]|uniref:Uncharacterized protein n=1 Tax=Cryobacterium psychrotolerans TaxID=386301 RepID=A0A1G9E637_9MICO|nr:hypothetical protein [Cryobacterium psychrotolerans]TFD86410.1 hypothetical protein E3T56_07450 [Cryobacterium psychrotolerans]SDK71563.1 hypothetical protein SAMN05216282_11142 [Cryobacterium psychrotolerans]